MFNTFQPSYKDHLLLNTTFVSVVSMNGILTGLTVLHRFTAKENMFQQKQCKA